MNVFTVEHPCRDRKRARIGRGLPCWAQTAVAVAWFHGSVGLAGIPEPDVVLYGSLCLHGSPQSDTDTDVVVRAVVTVDKEDRIVGEYHMGDEEAAGRLYVLRIRRESGADGSPQSGHAARAGQTVRIQVQRKEKTPIEADSFPLPQLGTIQRSDLMVGTSSGLDNDADFDLRDFARFQNCFTGPGGTTSPACSTVDQTGDQDVDLEDLGVLATTFGGPC